MVTPQGVHEAEQQVHRWHEERSKLESSSRSPQLPAARLRRVSFQRVCTDLRVRVARRRDRLATHTRQASEPPRTVSTLALLQAVARGEISPEAADRLFRG